MTVPAWLWIVFTLVGSAAQTARTAMQRELTETLGTLGATHVRFLFGLPFGLLFLAIAAVTLDEPLPVPNGRALVWLAFGSASQILATALMLAAMRERSFVVATALVKIEPVWVAIASALFLGEQVTATMMAAILVATGGVLLISWPRWYPNGDGPSLYSAFLGLAAGVGFGCAAMGYRGGIGALGATTFIAGATTALAIALLMQTAALTGYLAIRKRDTLAAIFQSWRPSLFAGFMGAFASQFWFLAFALQSAALVRTVALIEILFALGVSKGIFKQGLCGREAAGIVMLIVGIVVLLNSS